MTRQKECAHAFPQQLLSDLNDEGDCLIKDRHGSFTGELEGTTLLLSPGL